MPSIVSEPFFIHLCFRHALSIGLVSGSSKYEWEGILAHHTFSFDQRVQSEEMWQLLRQRGYLIQIMG